MREEVQSYIKQRPEVKHFLRVHPIWYRYLSRNPRAIHELDQEVKKYYGKTFPQRLEKLQSNVNMAKMLFDMFKPPIS